jgi:hypothetical protein
MIVCFSSSLNMMYCTVIQPLYTEPLRMKIVFINSESQQSTDVLDS